MQAPTRTLRGAELAFVYRAKNSAAALCLEGKKNLLRLQQDFPLTEVEGNALEDGVNDSKVQLPPFRNRGFDPQRDTQPGARQPPRRLSPSTTQPVNFWWNRLGKNEPSHGAWEIHSRRRTHPAD